MISPVCQKGFQDQKAGSGTTLDIISEENTIFAMNHHDGFMNENMIRFVNKSGTIT
jgi:hypothetical protein